MEIIIAIAIVIVIVVVIGIIGFESKNKYSKCSTATGNS